MSDAPKKKDQKKESAPEFERVVKKMLETPPKPRKFKPKSMSKEEK